jgi:hypothetical protein
VPAASADAAVLQSYDRDIDAAYEQARETGDLTRLTETVRRWWFEADAWRDPGAQGEFYRPVRRGLLTVRDCPRLDRRAQSRGSARLASVNCLRLRPCITGCSAQFGATYRVGANFGSRLSCHGWRASPVRGGGIARRYEGRL